MNVVLADDHDLVRGGIQALLELLPDVEVVAEASSGEELLAVLERIEPDLVITDIHMPGMDGLTAIAKMRARHPTLRILVLSMHATGEFVRRAVANGANGYLMKHAAPKELQHAVQTIFATGSYFDARVARVLLEPMEAGAGDELTQRQIEVLVLAPLSQEPLLPTMRVSGMLKPCSLATPPDAESLDEKLPCAD